MEKSYKYRFDRRTLYRSGGFVLFVLLLGAGLYGLYAGGLLSAWFTSFVIALLALMSLSIPRRIVLDERTMQIRCLLDLTEIPYEEIASVRRLDRRTMRRIIPLFGVYGFFGYYGHYFDLKHLERVLLYASEWDHFVEVTDLYENRIIVSCSDPDDLIAELSARADLSDHSDEQEDEEE